MRKPIAIAFLTLALVVVFAGTVLATAAAGFHGTILSRGTTSGSVYVPTADIKLKAASPVDMVTATVTIDPLGSSGWHHHPGMVFVTVVSGTVTFYDGDCQATSNANGSAFVESGDDTGLARNESSTVPAVVHVTYIVPAGTPNSGLRIDDPNPGCPQS
jgi:quercetin dioxygenase-like cupin family protein